MVILWVEWYFDYEKTTTTFLFPIIKIFLKNAIVLQINLCYNDNNIFFKKINKSAKFQVETGILAEKV